MENKPDISNHIGHPHKVPNTYFDKSRQEILDRTVRQTSSPSYSLRKWSVVTASLSFLFVIGFFLLSDKNNIATELPESIAIEQSEYDLHYDLLANVMEADILDDALDLNLDEELNELIISSIDGDYDDTDIYINDFELELDYYDYE